MKVCGGRQNLCSQGKSDKQRPCCAPHFLSRGAGSTYGPSQWVSQITSLKASIRQDPRRAGPREGRTSGPPGLFRAQRYSKTHRPSPFWKDLLLMAQPCLLPPRQAQAPVNHAALSPVPQGRCFHLLAGHWSLASVPAHGPSSRDRERAGTGGSEVMLGCCPLPRSPQSGLGQRRQGARGQGAHLAGLCWGRGPHCTQVQGPLMPVPYFYILVISYTAF